MLKKLNDWLHLWLGLASGIIVLIVSLTGCMLVFQEEIESLIQPYRHVDVPINTTPLPPSRIRVAAEQAMPGKKAYSIRYNGADRSANISFNSDSLVFIDPYTARILAIVDHEDFFHEVEEGHTSLWLPPKVGHVVVSYATLVFAILLITGLVLWWPKKWNRTGIQQAFRVKWSGSVKRVNYDLHNVWGFYSLIPALLMALTGMMMGIRWFSTSVYWTVSGGNDQPSRVELVSDTTKIGSLNPMTQVDKIWYRSVNELANNKSLDLIVSFPQKASETVNVYTNTESYKYQSHFFDQHTLKKLPAEGTDTDPFAQASLANQLRRINYSLHVGSFGDLVSKSIYFLASLICASLPVTGFLVWWGKRKKSGKAKPSRRRQSVKPGQLITSSGTTRQS